MTGKAIGCGAAVGVALVLAAAGWGDEPLSLPAIQRGNADQPLRASPDKKYTVKQQGNDATLFDVTNERAVGDKLSHGVSRINVNPPCPHAITCWAFSPDGLLLATGGGYKKLGERIVELNEGEVCLWEVPTGRLLRTVNRGPDRRDRRFGIVRAVAFSADGKTVQVEAETFEIDGP